ncbi:MAG TPA: carboxypeptidase-like regulatory domain-containing protein [Solirubrobacteraceae bacterium]|nr:carboxypeptidase-like regulatory domain-containing protein [Solirubrobacteraceae bacterium]
MSSERGITLIEVLISAIIVAAISIATFTGFDVSSAATADERSHSQADAIAQQWEERMRGMQVSDVSVLNQTLCVDEKGVDLGVGAPCPVSVAGTSGTIFTVQTNGQFVSDASGTSSCSAAGQSADYIQTTTTVTWPSLGSRPPVTETGIVTPPVSGELLVQDINGANPVPGVSVTETGPATAPSSQTKATGASGCVIFTTLPAGDYTVTANQNGYVDKDGKQNVSYATSFTTGSTGKVVMQYDRAGTIAVSYKSNGAASTGDAFTVFNTGMTLERSFGTPVANMSTGTYSAAASSSTTIFPFPSAYSVYAGTCSADAPSIVSSGAVADPPVTVTPGGAPPAASIEQPPVNIKVMSGNLLAPGVVVTNAVGTLTDTGCGTVRTFTTTPGGALPHPPAPFGTYSLCLTKGGTKWTGVFSNNRIAGPLTPPNNGGVTAGRGTIYLGVGAPGAVPGASCP